MTLESILTKVKERTDTFNGKGYRGFLAVQITLIDLRQVFHVEIKNGQASVKPCGYNGWQAHLIISSVDFVRLLDRKLDPMLALTAGRLRVEGNAGKALELARLFF